MELSFWAWVAVAIVAVHIVVGGIFTWAVIHFGNKKKRQSPLSGDG
jgi:hypothetical protein